MKLIFTGGTGRSGTTVTSHILGLNRQLLKVGGEARFFSDPDGLVHLGRYLTDQWTFLAADKAFHRFVDLMEDISKPWKSWSTVKTLNRKVLPAMGLAPMRYQWVNLCDYLPKKQVREAVGEFLGKLSMERYPGYWVGTPSYQRNPVIYSSSRIDKSIYAKAAQEFVDRLVEPFSRDKTYFIDDSPESILYIEELLQLFPESKFIHCYRDLRDVVASTKGKHWGDSDVRKLCPWIKSVCEKWINLKSRVPAESFIEIRLEELIADPKGNVERLCNFLDIPFDDAMLQVDLSKGNTQRWKFDLKPEDARYVEEYLADIMQHYGYQ
jgi:hypothetical protein